MCCRRRLLARLPLAAAAAAAPAAAGVGAGVGAAASGQAKGCSFSAQHCCGPLGIIGKAQQHWLAEQMLQGISRARGGVGDRIDAAAAGTWH